MTTGLLEKVIETLYEAIRDANGLPSGHLYAVCMGFMSLSTYQGIIQVMKDRKMIRESGNILYVN